MKAKAKGSTARKVSGSVSRKWIARPDGAPPTTPLPYDKGLDETVLVPVRVALGVRPMTSETRKGFEALLDRLDSGK